VAGGGEDKHSKKHPASAKKKRDLKKKGTVPKSQDVPMAIGLLAAFGAMLGLKGMLTAQMVKMMRGPESFFAAIKDVGTPDGIDVTQLAMTALFEIVLISGPILVAVLIAAFVANLAQTGIIITGEQLKPNLNKINPKNKFKQWFSIKSAQELVKSLGKILFASFMGYLVLKGSMGAIAESVAIPVTTGCDGSSECALALMTLGASIIKKLFIYIIILYVVIAAIDYGFQKKNFEKEHKMTDKEVKDEYKNSEGDPYQKGKRRQMAQQIAMQTAQDHVPQSDVVVINPTELAIALKYDPDVSPVPWVVAKGEVHDADEIRASARKAGVPVVRNKPLARALYELCEIGDIVPEDLYRPVAEILAYVFQLKDQSLAEANQAAQASPGAQHVSDAAAATQRLTPDTDGVHDLADVAVPVGAGAGAQQAVQQSAMAAGAVVPGTHASWGLAAQPEPAPAAVAADGSTWGAASAAAPAAAHAHAGADDDDRYSWR
jgi:flagellar biosynthetic protein FlhB